MKLLKFAPALFLCISLTVSVNAQTVAPFKAGDRVAFLGNSITDGGHYHSYIWLYYMTHFPNTRVTFFNVGVGGDNVKQMIDRFPYEVLPLKPNIMTLTWGMNDSKYFEWNSQKADTLPRRLIEIAEERYAVMDKLLKQYPEIKKLFLLGSPYDATTKSNKQNIYPGKSEVFQKLIDFQTETAKKNGWEYVDFDHPMLAINKEQQAKDTLFSLEPNDRIHPDNDGHLVMAYLFLKAQGLAGKPVADFSVNAKSLKVTKAINCNITNVINTDKKLSFDYLAYSLPYPMDTIPRGFLQRKKQAEGLKWVPFTKEFNQEMLTVKDLPDGNYKLLMDGQMIGTWTAKDFGTGINLAEQIYTPEYQQAIAIRELNEERLDIEHRGRNFAWVQFNFMKDKGLLYANNKAAMDLMEANSKGGFLGSYKELYSKAQFKVVRDAWQAEQDALINAIYAANKPQKHTVTIVKQ